MRFSNRAAFKTVRSSSYRFVKKTFQKVLVNNLGLTLNEAKRVVEKNEKIFTYPQHRIINNCEILQKYNVKIAPLKNLEFCIELNNWRLQHRINILKDLGVKTINLSMVAKLVSVLSKPIPVFKQHYNIPVKQDLKTNIFSRLGESLTSISTLNSLLQNELLVREYYNICLLYCKTRIFDLPLSNDVLLCSTTKYKSISMIAEMLKVLRDDLGCDNEYIKNNPTVIGASAENVKSLLNNFKDEGIYGLPIVEVLKQHPCLLFADTNNILRLMLSFKHYEIPDDYVRKYLRIFTMGNDIFIERMQKILKHPDLHIWRKYPRILQLIFHQNMVKDRLEYLRHFNRVKWARLHSVMSTKCNIEKNVQYSSGMVMSSKILTYLLKTELGPENSYVIEDLRKHPYWRTAGYTDIEKMLIYLKKYFTINEICTNIHVVLYTQSTIEKLMADIKKQYSKDKGYSLSNSQYLALCLYMLEKDNNFTGDSIWHYGHNSMQQSKLSSSGDQSAMVPTDKDANTDNIE